MSERGPANRIRANRIRANGILGYPQDARLLIVNADDFGMCHTQNVGTFRAIREGLVRSCSLMAPAPWGLHGAQLLRENPGVPFGVHLTLVSEFRTYRWGPLLPSGEVGSLVDESGYFHPDDRIPELVRNLLLHEAEREFRAQIEWVLASGLAPAHLDSHYHVHEERDDLFELTVDLALEYGLALRTREAGHIEALRARGYPTNDHDLLDSGRHPPADKPVAFAKLLRELPEGVSEWAFHPAVVTPELQAIMVDPRIPGVTAVPADRQSDFDFITSDEAAAIVAEEGIELITYADLQPFWRRRGSA